MNDLRELLSTRQAKSPGELLSALREGLSIHPADSGNARELHALLLAYFALDAAAVSADFSQAFCQHPATAQRLVAMLEQDGEHKVVGLMRSLLAGRPQPTGALREGLQHARSAATAHGDGVAAALQAFAQVALQDSASATEMELSLCWCAVEEGLLDRVEQNADQLAFHHGASHRQAATLAQRIDAMAAGTDIRRMLEAFTQARHATIIAKASEWAIDRENAPPQSFDVAVRHEFHSARPGTIEIEAHAKVVAPLRALYEYCSGAELFIPISHEPKTAALTIIPASDWASEREIVLTWLTLDDATASDALPSWVRTLVPFAVLTGDASRWVTPIEGPYAGTVMLSNQDVMDEHVRYPSIAHFIAALRVSPETILGNGGYVSYVLPGCEHLIFPIGYREQL